VLTNLSSLVNKGVLICDCLLIIIYLKSLKTEKYLKTQN